MDNPHDFVIRQYAHLVGSGVSTEMARIRLLDTFGDDVAGFLDAGRVDEHVVQPGDPGLLTSLLRVVTELGDNSVDARAAFAAATDEAGLFALDWWRPVRTFLIYIAFLLAFAVAIALMYYAWVLPSFASLDHSMDISGGAAGWIMTWGAIREFAPLILIAIGLIALAIYWYRMRKRIAALRPFWGSARWSAWYGRSGEQYRALLCLEYASILHAGGVPDAAVMQRAVALAGWPAGQRFETRDGPLDYVLEQACRVGTFDAELQWQRRLCWSHAQGQLEMARDRLMLGMRVLFYILIGCMVTVLYLPIFSIATTFGAY